MTSCLDACDPNAMLDFVGECASRGYFPPHLPPLEVFKDILDARPDLDTLLVYTLAVHTDTGWQDARDMVIYNPQRMLLIDGHEARCLAAWKEGVQDRV
jgi:hypothetical protein